MDNASVNIKILTSSRLIYGGGIEGIPSLDIIAEIGNTTIDDTAQHRRENCQNLSTNLRCEISMHFRQSSSLRERFYGMHMLFIEDGRFSLC